MRLFNWLRGLFVENPKIYCGGIGCMEILGRFGQKTNMKIFYSRPDSNLIFDYKYDYEVLIEGKSKLKNLEDEKNSYAETAKELMNDFFIPYAKKIFHHCEGDFFDQNGNRLENRKPSIQIELIEKYHSYYLADLCTVAYLKDTQSKKKD